MPNSQLLCRKLFQVREIHRFAWPFCVAYPVFGRQLIVKCKLQRIVGDGVPDLRQILRLPELLHELSGGKTVALHDVLQ